jgi:hypothetical protein
MKTITKSTRFCWSLYLNVSSDQKFHVAKYPITSQHIRTPTSPNLRGTPTPPRQAFSQKAARVFGTQPPKENPTGKPSPPLPPRHRNAPQSQRHTDKLPHPGRPHGTPSSPAIPSSQAMGQDPGSVGSVAELLVAAKDACHAML